MHGEDWVAGAPLRPYPQSQEAERAFLGGLILEPDRLVELVDQVRPDDFYRPEHQAFFELLKDLAARGEVIDEVTLSERLARGGHADRYGGIAYVLELPDHAPSTANLRHYADVIREKAMLRRLIAACDRASREAFDGPADVNALLEGLLKQVSGLGTDRADSSWSQISEITDDAIMLLRERAEAAGEVQGVPTGFEALDRQLAGMQRGDLLILAARPSMGKTALALNIAGNAAKYGDVAVAIYSLEMGKDQLVNRMLTTEAEVDASKVRTGQLDDEEWNRMIAASDVVSELRVFIDETPALSIGDVRARARRLHATTAPDLGLIVVDYLQLMRGDDPKAPRIQQVGDISRGLKALAKDLQVPVVALSQLNRGVESRQDKRPMLSDLRESGAIEQDADVILFIYRDDYYNNDSTDKGLAEVIIAKQRNGSTGTVKLRFIGRFTRFDSYEELEAGPLVS